MKVHVLLGVLSALIITTHTATTTTTHPTETTLPATPTSPLSPPSPPLPSTITIPNSLPASNSSSGEITGGADSEAGSGGPPPPPLPVWAQCLSSAPPEAVTSLPVLFRFWCSNYNQIIACIAEGLPTEASQNPLDQFVQLHFDKEQVTSRSEQLCRNLDAVSSQLQCTQASNDTMVEWCQARFSQGQHYVFAMTRQHAFDSDPKVYKQLACQVTEDTTGCLGSAMAGCDVDVKRALLAFYSLFTNQSCVADPADPYTTPAPPPSRPAPPRDVVITCAQRIAKALTPSRPLAQNASSLDQLLYGLRHNCRSFEARYNCYDEELNKITNPSFRDIWLSFTFNTENAIRSQTQFCDGFEGGIADSLSAECYNQSQPGLQQCEQEYSADVLHIQTQWVHSQLDNVAVHKAACRSSIQRAFCLRDAFIACGETLAESMLASELGTLPDICFTLLPNDNGHDDDTSKHVPEPEPTRRSDNGHDDGSRSHSQSGSSSVDGGQRKAESSPSSHDDTSQSASGKGKGDDSLATGLGANVLVTVVVSGIGLLSMV